MHSPDSHLTTGWISGNGESNLHLDWYLVFNWFPLNSNSSAWGCAQEGQKLVKGS